MRTPSPILDEAPPGVKGEGTPRTDLRFGQALAFRFADLISTGVTGESE
jgi:hypothetical protein